jgi:WD40 repeat protein
LLASASFNNINLWSLPEGNLLNNLTDYSVNSLAFSPDSKILASGSGSDITIKLWKMPNVNL